MCTALGTREPPRWLVELQDLGCLPIKELLSGSLYYPASGLDGNPVRHLVGYIYSFVYVDYGFDRDEIVQALHDSKYGFRGYRVKWYRDVQPLELVPNGWKPIPPSENDGTPKLPFKNPFAVWAVLDRMPEYTDNHGPERFSLLFVGGDGVATFQALYHGNQTAPEVVAVIHPGTGWGENWTDYVDPEKIFARSVMKNPAGVPQYVLHGGYDHFWLEYEECIPLRCDQRREICLCKRSNKKDHAMPRAGFNS